MLSRVIVVYDNWCPKCTRFIRQIKKLDWLNLIETKQLRRTSDLSQFAGLHKELARKQMASFKHKNWVYGYGSIHALVVRIPVFWVFAPIFWMLKISRLGALIYQELALKRNIIPLSCEENVCEI